jgi:hypothetical protein
MIRFLSAIAVVFLTGTHVAARDAPVGLGQASISCGTWMADKRSPALATTDNAWVLGFISAFNLYMLNVDDDVAHGTDNKGLLSWIDTYCVAHPLDSLESATSSLIIELIKKTRAH